MMKDDTTNWTDEDERLLQELVERKSMHEAERRDSVQSVVNGFYFREMNETDLVDALIENATELRAALKPFAKE